VWVGVLRRRGKRDGDQGLADDGRRRLVSAAAGTLLDLRTWGTDDLLSLVGARVRLIQRRDVMMTIVFDGVYEWDGSFLTGWANRKGERIRCQAGRAPIAELAEFTEASSYEIGMRKQIVFELLIRAFTRKIERGEFDGNPIKGVTLSIHDLTVEASAVAALSRVPPVP
jgi:hypothetical protein